ncbi:MAG: radical SAM protein [Nanoarchaeota archaeon]
MTYIGGVKMELVTTEKQHFGPLAKGCKDCVVGRKSVLFITGLCHYRCFYCPISDDKRYKDVVKINERPLLRPDAPEGTVKTIEEIRLCQSTGVGITGGDPLMRLDRTCRYIEGLKKEFGSSFHIHLYTTLDHVTQEALLRLEKAGLDELRLHFDVTDILLWEKAHFAEGFQMTIGAEIPSIPGYVEKTKELIHFCKTLGFIDFFNLNELEYSDASQHHLKSKSFEVKDSSSYAIRGSEEMALKLIEFGKQLDFPVHYCSAGFKDRVQLGNRLRLRAQSVARPFDNVDEQGMLFRAELKPIDRVSVDKTSREMDYEKDDYEEHEKEVDHVVEKLGLLEEPEYASEIISDDNTLFEGFTLEGIRQQLIRNYEIPEELIEVQGDRILTAPHILKEIWPQIKRKRKFFAWKSLFTASLVTEYPTSDHFPLEREGL